MHDRHQRCSERLQDDQRSADFAGDRARYIEPKPIYAGDLSGPPGGGPIRFYFQLQAPLTASIKVPRNNSSLNSALTSQRQSEVLMHFSVLELWATVGPFAKTIVIVMLLMGVASVFVT